MYKVMIYTLLSLTTLTCGRFEPAPGIVSAPEELEPYIQRYRDLKAENVGSPALNHSITVKFDDLQTGYLGVCRITTTRTGLKSETQVRVIAIDSDFWEFMSEAERLQLVLHEFGHCDLDLDHGEGGAIMNPQLIPEIDFVSNFEVLVDSLFAPR